MSIETCLTDINLRLERFDTDIRHTELDLGRVTVQLDRPNGPISGSERDNKLKQRALYIAELCSAYDQVKLLKELRKEMT